MGAGHWNMGGKVLVRVFVAAVIFYVAAYAAIEWLRTRKGPWSITFINSNAGPLLLVNQHRLGVTNFQLTLNPSAIAGTNRGQVQTIAFDQAKPVPFDVPFGKCVFLDTTFLPGTVTLQLSGHEIELLPRVLIIDHAEYNWKAGMASAP